MTVRVHLLGQFAVERDGDQVPRTAWNRRRPVELLVALALAPGHSQHREEVIDRLWPDKDLEAGANNLYRTLHDLRRIAGDDIVSVERGVVQLADDAWVDVDAFEKAASAGQPDKLAEAVELYRGDLLPDDPYSDDVIARREGLRQRFVDVALRLARHRGDDPELQIDVLRRALEIDPTLEEAHRRLMEALAATDRRKDALRQYSACVKALRAHLDTEPSPETDELKRRIQAGELDARPGPSATTRDDPGWSHVATRLLGAERPSPIRGRDAELAKLADFVESDCGVLLLIGEGGVGKTRLAVECARLCGEANAVVLAGLGYEFDGTAPYTPFVDAWSDYLRCVGRPPGDNPFVAFRPVPGASAQEDRLRLFQSVERSLDELSGHGGICLILEDLHQADESSLYLFHHLARAARHMPLVLVGTLRDERAHGGSPVQTLLDGLSRERLARRIELDPLDLSATRALVADLHADDLPDEAVEEIFRLSEGNPFYAEELVRSLGERAGADSPSVPADLLQTIHARVRGLGRDAERLLTAASVEGMRFHFDAARAAAGMDEQTALDTLDLGLEARVIEELDDEYRFRHALTREALYSSLSNARRIYLHRAMADALEARNDAELSEALAFHHNAAGQLDRALPHLMTAAERAQARLGFGEAVHFCEQALELMDSLGIDTGADRWRLMMSMGGMRVALGDLDRAIRDLDAAAALPAASDGWHTTATQRANAQRLAALAMIERGDLANAETRLNEALASLDGEPDSPELSNVLYLFSQLRWHQSRHAEAFEMAEKCLRQAERLDDSEGVAKGYEMLALACHSLGDWKKGTEYEQQRSTLADDALDVASAFDIHL